MNVELVRTRAKIKFHLDNLNEQCEKKNVFIKFNYFFITPQSFKSPKTQIFKVILKMHAQRRV